MRAGARAIAFALLAGCGKGVPPAPPPEAATARAASEEWRLGKPLDGADAAGAQRALARAEELLAAGTPDAAAFRQAEIKYKEAIAAREAKREEFYRSALDARAKARARRTRLSEQQVAIVAAAAAGGDDGKVWVAVRDITTNDVFKSEKLLATDVALEKAEALFSGGRNAEARACFATAESDLGALLARLAESEAEARARLALEDAERAVADLRLSVDQRQPPPAELAMAALDAARRAAARRDFPIVTEEATKASDLAGKTARYQKAAEEANTNRYMAMGDLDAWVKGGAAENDASRAGRAKLREGDACLLDDPEAASEAFKAASLSFRSAFAASGEALKARLAELRAKKTPAPLPPAPLDSKKAAEGVRLALDWFARHQDDDGRWSSAEFIRHDPRGPPRADTGGGLYDAGATALALLCFLEAGYTDHGTGDAGYYNLNVEHGLRWLRACQSDDGVFGTRATPSFMYNHAIATLAMSEAARRTRDPTVRKSAEAGVRFIEMCRNPYLAWSYEPRGGTNDTSLTTWCIEAIVAAEAAGITVDKDALGGALAWVTRLTDEKGRTGYSAPGGPPARLRGLESKFPGSRSESMTAAGILVRILARETPRDDNAIALGTKLIFNQPPMWSPDAGSIDMYYWHAATRALRLSGCPDWAVWSRTMQAVALRWQVPETGAHNAGSWDPIGAWGSQGGRVYSTAMMTLALIESAKAAP